MPLLKYSEVIKHPRFADAAPEEQARLNERYWSEFEKENPNNEWGKSQSEASRKVFETTAALESADPLSRRALEFQHEAARTTMAVNNLDADGGWESPEQRTQLIEGKKAKLEAKRQQLDKTFSLFKPEVAKEMEPTWKALDRYASDSGYFGGEGGLTGAGTVAADVTTFGMFSEKAAEDKVKYEKLRDTVSKDFNLAPEEVDDVMRHRLNKYDGEVSRDAFGGLHFKDSALVKNTDEIEDIINKSKLPESVKATAKEEAPQRVALFKENISNTAKQNFPELAKELELGDDINENYRKIVDATNKSKKSQSASGFGAFALDRFANVGVRGVGLFSDKIIEPLRANTELFSESENYALDAADVLDIKAKSMGGINALSEKIQQDKVRIFGTDAATVGQGVGSVVESIGLAALTGGAGNLIKAERIARAGATGKLILGGVKAGLTVAPTAAIYGGEKSLATWERASQSDDPAIRARAGELAIKDFLGEFGITTGMSMIGLGGAEKIGAAFATRATRQAFAKSVSGALGRVVVNFGVNPIAEGFEESLITAVEMIHVQQQLNPDMTDEQVRSSIKDTIVSTLIATGGVAGPKGTIDLIGDIKNLSTQDKTSEELHNIADAEYTARATEENLPETETAGRAFPTSGSVSLAEIERERAAQIEQAENDEDRQALTEATPEELAGEWGVDLKLISNRGLEIAASKRRSDLLIKKEGREPMPGDIQAYADRPQELTEEEQAELDFLEANAGDNMDHKAVADRYGFDLKPTKVVSEKAPTTPPVAEEPTTPPVAKPAPRYTPIPTREERVKLENEVETKLEEESDTDTRERKRNQFQKLRKDHQDARRERDDAQGNNDNRGVRTAEIEMSQIEDRMRELAGLEKVHEGAPITEEEQTKQREFFAKRAVEIQAKLDAGEALTKSDRMDWDAAGKDPKLLPEESQKPGAAKIEGASGEAKSPVAPVSEPKLKETPETFTSPVGNVNETPETNPAPKAAVPTELLPEGQAPPAEEAGGVEAEVATPISTQPAPNTAPRAENSVEPRPTARGEARDLWDDTYGQMRRGGQTHNNDGTPYQPTVFDETSKQINEDTAGMNDDQRRDSIGDESETMRGSNVKTLIDAGWVWDRGAKKFVNPENPSETPLQGLYRLAKKPTEQPSAQNTPAAPQSEQKVAQGKPIKLSGFKGSTQSTNRDLIIESLGEPTETGLVETDSGVKVEMHPFEDGVELRAVQNLGGTKGAASETLDRITEEADALGTKLYLYPKPFGTGERLSKAQLVAWYERKGFVMSKDGETMVRTPKETKPAQPAKAEEVATDKTEDKLTSPQEQMAADVPAPAQDLVAVTDAILAAMGMTREDASDILPASLPGQQTTTPAVEPNGQMTLFQDPESEGDPAAKDYIKSFKGVPPKGATRAILDYAGDPLLARGELGDLPASTVKEIQLADDLIQKNTKGVKKGTMWAAVTKVGRIGMNNFLGTLWKLNNPRTKPGWVNFQDDKGIKKLSDILSFEVAHALTKDGSGKDWYKAKIEEMYSTLTPQFPELAKDGKERFFFSIILAATSNGQDVLSNMEDAIRIYKGMRGKDNIPLKVKIKRSSRNGPVNNSILGARSLIRELGWEKAKEFMLEPISVSQLKKDHEIDLAGELAGHTVIGAMLMGPKIGSFWGNLNGHYDSVTMDLWFTRSMNRLSGDNSTLNHTKLAKALEDLSVLPSVPSNVRKEIKDYVNAARKGEGEAWTKIASDVREEVDVLYDYLTSTMAAYSASGFAVDQRTDTNKKVKSIISIIDGGEESPDNGKHRAWMRDVVEAAQVKLRKAGIDITNADLQAVLWFHEKDLYTRFGATSSRGGRMDYAIAADTAIKAGRMKQKLPAQGKAIVSQDQPFTLENEPPRKAKEALAAKEVREYEARMAAKRGGVETLQQRPEKLGPSPAGTIPAFRNKVIRLTHWSYDASLKKTDPSKHGKGGAGEELKRQRAYPSIYQNRTYVGFGSYKKEQQIGPHRYSIEVDGNSMYDYKKDPLDLYPDAADLRKAGYSPFDQQASYTLYEKRIKEAGFAGYVHTNFKAGILFGKATAVPEKPGNSSLPIDTGKVSPTVSDTLKQDTEGPKGQVTFAGLSKALIQYFENADGSTAVHEPIHVARRFLLNRRIPAENRVGITDEMIDAANNFVGSKDSNWTVAQEEKFARAFERHLWEGVNTGIAAVDSLMSKIKDFMRNIYKNIKGSSLDVELTPEVKALFDKLITRGETLKEQGVKPTAIPLKVEVKAKAQAKPIRKIPARKIPAPLPFGVKREDLDAARRRYSIPEQPGMVVRMTDEEAFDEAYAMMAKRDKGEDVLVSQQLVLNLMEDNRGTNKVEVALLAIHGFEIQKALKDLDNKIAKLDPGETQKRKAFETLQEALLNDFQDLVNVTQLQGSRAGLALQAMKLVANQVYSVDVMLRRRAIWKNTGKKPGQAKEPLTPAEARDTEEQSKKILELIKERERLMKELEDKYNREEAAAIISKKEKDVAKERKPAKPRGVLVEKATAIATSARDRLRAMGLGVTRLNQMAGERAQMPQFRRDSLESAKAMAAAGRSSEEIRAVTGWFPGRYDGKMRWEIPDSGAKLTSKWENLPAFGGFMGKPEYILLKDALNHPELFAAYPQLGDVWLSKQSGFFDFFGAVQGWFNPDTNSLNVTPNAQDPLSTLLHETQHWIQQREGFARGSNTESVMKGLSSTQKTAAVDKMQKKAAELIAKAEERLVVSEDTLNLTNSIKASSFDAASSVYEKADSDFSAAIKEFGSGTPEVRAAYDVLDVAKKEKYMAAGLDPSPSMVLSRFYLYMAVLNAESTSNLKSKAEAIRGEAREAILNHNELLLNASKSDEGFEAAVKAFDLSYHLYQNVAGEIESRDVQARASMTPEQLAAAAPYSSENIAEDDAIVLFQEAEAQAVASPPSREVSPALATKLEAGEKIRLFRAMQVIDGKLYPPMSALVEGKLRPPTEIGVWEQAEERPDLINKKGKFVLNKGNKATVPAAYNPYFHTSFSPLNDQFSSAYKRDNLVTVEVEVPASEQTSGYRAEGAKNAVGMAPWNVGPVSGKLPVGKKRQVMLSRYAKVLRVVPDSEVAGNIAKLLQGTGLSIPENVVTPSLKAELENQGVSVTPLDARFKSETTTLRQDSENTIVEILDALSDVGTEYLASGIKDEKAFTEKLVTEFGEEFRDQAETVFGLAKDKLAKLASTARQKTPQELSSLIDPTKGISEKMVYNMALGFMREGLKGEAVLDAVTKLLQNDYPNLTREEVVVAFTGYGRIKIPSQEQIRKDLRELRTIERLDAQLADLARGQLPKRTGLQRDKTTPTVRSKMKQVEQAIRDSGLQHNDKKDRLAGALDPIRTRLKNEIADMDQAIKTKTALNKAKKEPKTDAEIEKLKKERDAMKKRYDATFGIDRKKISVEAQIKRASAMLDRQIKALEAEARGEILNNPTKVKLDSPDLKAKRERLESLRGAKRAAAEALNPKKTAAEIATDRLRGSIEKSIERFEYFIRNGTYPPTVKGVAPTLNSVLKEMMATRDRLRDTVREIQKDRRILTPPEVIARRRALVQLNKTIADLNARIAKRDFSKRAKKPESTDPAVRNLKATVANLRATLDQLKKDALKPVSSEEKRIQRMIAASKKRKENYERRLAAGDFAKPVKRDTKEDSRLTAVKIEEAKAKSDWMEKAREYAVANMNSLQKVKYTIKNMLIIRKLTALGAEFGIAFRQLLFFTYRIFFNPKAVSITFIKAFNATFSRDKEIEYYNNFIDRPYSTYDKRMGMKLISPFADLDRMQEMDAVDPEVLEKINNKIPKWIPLRWITEFLLSVERFNRVSTNAARVYFADNMLDKGIRDSGNPTEEELKIIGNATLVFTGRGSLGKGDLEKGVAAMNMVTISARYAVSRAQVVLLQPLWTTSGDFKGTAKLRAHIATDIYGKAIIGRVLAGTLIYQVAKALIPDDEEEEIVWNPTSSKFGVVYYKGTTIELNGGARPYINLLAQAVMGYKLNSKGEVVPLRGEGSIGFGKQDFRDALYDFVRNRENIDMAMILDTITQKHFGDIPMTKTSFTRQLLEPIIIEDLVNIFEEHGIVEGSVLATALFFGVGVRTPWEKTEKKEPEYNWIRF